MKDRTAIAIACLHVSTLLYFAIGLVFLALIFVDDEEFRVPAGLGIVGYLGCRVVAGAVEVIAAGLHCRRYWAWCAGLCLLGIYVPSLFLPLGALGLWGLLAPGSRAAFGVDPAAIRAGRNPPSMRDDP